MYNAVSEKNVLVFWPCSVTFSSFSDQIEASFQSQKEEKKDVFCIIEGDQMILYLLAGFGRFLRYFGVLATDSYNCQFGFLWPIWYINILRACGFTFGAITVKFCSWKLALSSHSFFVWHFFKRIDKFFVIEYNVSRPCLV